MKKRQKKVFYVKIILYFKQILRIAIINGRKLLMKMIMMMRKQLYIT